MATGSKPRSLNGHERLSLGRAHAVEGHHPRADSARESASRASDRPRRAGVESAGLELKNCQHHETVEYLERARAFAQKPRAEGNLAKVKTLIPRNG